jgi:hypothetical protein
MLGHSILRSCLERALCLALSARCTFPRRGTRKAELMEMPIMLVVTIVAARWTVLHLGAPRVAPARLGMGCITLALMLLAGP